MIPEYLDNKHMGICYGCPEAVKQNPETGRWYITIGHPGFNTPKNNREGYATRATAKATLDRLTGKKKGGA